MNLRLCLAITTGLLSALWGWVAVALGLPVWAGFLGCTAGFACTQDGLRGQGIVLCTLTSGAFWALFIGYVSALAPHYAAIGYGVTGMVAFIMCYQSRHQWLGFVPGTFIGASAMFASHGDWFHVVPALWIGLLFGCAMRIAAHGLQTLVTTTQTNGAPQRR